MILGKCNKKSHKLVEQEDISETVLWSSTSTSNKYTYDITLSKDPTKYDYLLLYMYAPSGKRNVLCIAKYFSGSWYAVSSATVYRTISLALTSTSTSMHVEVAEWFNSSNNNGVQLRGVVGVNRGGHWLLDFCSGWHRRLERRC